MLNLPIQKFQIGLYTFSLVLATAAIVLRLVARRYTRIKLQLNDWIMILAYVNILALGIAANIAVVHGEMGPHQSEVSPQRAKQVFKLNMKMTIIIPFLLSSSSFLVKMSITHFYIVLFPHTLLTKICKAQLFLLTVCWLGGGLPYFYMCRPFALTWNRTLTGECWDVRPFWLGMSVVALFFDLTLVVLPIPVVWGLKCSVGKKVRLTALFSLGLFICIITLVRITKSYTLDFHDLSYSAARAVMVAVPEPVLSLVGGCIPIMVPLFRHASNKLRSAMSTTQSNQPSYESHGGLLAKLKGSSRMSDTSKQRRLDDHLYPMGSTVDITSLSGSVVHSPMSPLRSQESIDNLVGGWGMKKSTDVFAAEDTGAGITVLKEVHVDSKSRKGFDSVV